MNFPDSDANNDGVGDGYQADHRFLVEIWSRVFEGF